MEMLGSGTWHRLWITALPARSRAQAWAGHRGSPSKSSATPGNDQRAAWGSGLSPCAAPWPSQSTSGPLPVVQTEFQVPASVPGVPITTKSLHLIAVRGWCLGWQGSVLLPSHESHTSCSCSRAPPTPLSSPCAAVVVHISTVIRAGSSPSAAAEIANDLQRALHSSSSLEYPGGCSLIKLLPVITETQNTQPRFKHFVYVVEETGRLFHMPTNQTTTFPFSQGSVTHFFSFVIVQNVLLN